MIPLNYSSTLLVSTEKLKFYLVVKWVSSVYQIYEEVYEDITEQPPFLS